MKQPQKNVWGSGGIRAGEYKRHSVKRDVKRFCGWTLLLKAISLCQNDQERALMAFLFETGGRISEVLALRKEMFTVRTDTDPPIIVVQNAPLVKRYEKVDEYLECNKKLGGCGEHNEKGRQVCVSCDANLQVTGKRRYITRKLEEVRNDFSFRADEPLAKIVLEWLQTHDDYLFLNHMTGKPYSRKWAYLIMRRIGDELGIPLYNHRLRAERASHLGKGKLRAESLLEWFTWESWQTAKDYAKKGAVGLAEEMGVKTKEQNE